MTEKRRELMHKCMDGQFHLAPLMHELDRYRRCDEVLNWLYMHKIVGKELQLFLFQAFRMAIDNMVKWILSKVDKEKQLRPTIIGRDYKN